MSAKNQTVNQQELAEAFEVDRTTIRAWTSRGMPYFPGDRGKEHAYDVGISMWWGLCDEFTRNSNLQKLSPIQKIIYARIAATEIHHRDGSLDKDEDLADVTAIARLLARVGISDDEARRETWFVKGIVEGVGLQKSRRKTK